MLSVGRPRDATLIELHDRYADRLRKLGVHYESASVADTAAGKRYSESHAREREAAALTARLPERFNRVALDPLGRQLDSPQLARRLERWAHPGVALVVGGPTGLDPTLREGCDVVWSLSRLTFPHELVRVIVAEQLYRAVSLARGLPYHK